MKIRNRILVSILTAFSVGISIADFARADSWSAPQTIYADGNVGIGISGLSTIFSQNSRLQAVGDSGPSMKALCKSISTEGCSPTDKFNAYSVLAPCKSVNDSWCIEGLSIGANSENLIAGTLIRTLKTPTFAGSSDIGLVAGGQGSLWKVSNQMNAGGTDTYEILAKLSAVKSGTPYFQIQNLSVEVNPYKQVQGSFMPIVDTLAENPAGQKILTESGNDAKCAWQEYGLCGVKQDFLPETRIKLQLRIGNNLDKWLVGRFYDSKISISPLSNTQNQLSVEGVSASVPRLAIGVPYSNLSEIEKNAWDQSYPGMNYVQQPGEYFLGYGKFSQDFLSVMDAFKSETGDKASGKVNIWSFISQPVSNGCFSIQGSIPGVVSTNAMGVDSSPPTFENGAFVYHLSGYHFNPDGSVFQGTYDLNLSSEVAHCLYNIPQSLNAATVSRVNSDGSTNLTTNTVHDDGKWLHLSINGFTFSNPTIKVTFTHSDTLPVIPVESSIPQTSNSDKISILPKTDSPNVVPQKSKIFYCIKGKVVKEIKTAKCPTGYKKK